MRKIFNNGLKRPKGLEGVVAECVVATSPNKKSWDKKDALEEQIDYLKECGFQERLLDSLKPKSREKKALSLAGKVLFSSAPKQPTWAEFAAKALKNSKKGKRK